MVHTITEKILAQHSGKEDLSAGDIVDVSIDKVFTHDVFGPYVIDEFKKLKQERVWDNKKIVFIADHEVPACSIEARDHVHQMLRFSEEQGGIEFLIAEGICHQLMPERGYVKPGSVVLGTDSHTCTYGALGAFATGVGTTDMAAIWKKGAIWLRVPESIEIITTGELNKGVFAKDIILWLIGKFRIDGATYKAIEMKGEALKKLSLSSRLTIANMAVEMGAKNMVMEYDERVEQYLSGRLKDEDKNYTPVMADEGAVYCQREELNFSHIEPMLSGPRGVDDVKPLSRLKGKKITQAFIGSCTNGRFEDLKIASDIIKESGGKIRGSVHLIVTPASQRIYLEALEAGIIETFIRAGAVVTNSMCGFCSGNVGGVLSKDDVCIATNNRNFPSRLGHRDAQVYLASPASVAASAVTGEVTDPRIFIE
jgi:3-isopropylmalate/(R)-2-methylmalate dehydratase large subunit